MGQLPSKPLGVLFRSSLAHHLVSYLGAVLHTSVKVTVMLPTWLNQSPVRLCAQDLLLKQVWLPAGHHAQSYHVPKCQNYLMIYKDQDQWLQQFLGSSNSVSCGRFSVCCLQPSSVAGFMLNGLYEANISWDGAPSNHPAQEVLA